MPSPTVVFSAPRAIKSREYLEKQALVVGGVQHLGDVLARGIEMYSQAKQKEDSEKLQLLGSMMQLYGPDASQPLLGDLDEVMRHKGLGGLPKDPATGKFMAPPPTKDQVISKELQANPELRQEAVFKAATGKSRLELAIKQHEADAKEAHYKMQDDVARIRLSIERAKVSAISAKTREKDMPTDAVRMPDGSIKYLAELGGQLPEGAYVLNVREAEQAQKFIDREAKQAKFNLDKAKFATNAIYGAARVLYGPTKGAGEDPQFFKKHPEFKPAFRKVFTDQGMEPELQDEILGPQVGKEGGTWFTNFWKNLTPEQKAEIDKEATAPPGQQIPVEAGLKPGQEYPGVPGLKYMGQ